MHQEDLEFDLNCRIHQYWIHTNCLYILKKCCIEKKCIFIYFMLLKLGM